ncbi:Esterase/lipase [Streptomyces venezuelae]|nr:Esterase/lipase [Streptomyces venezuelae]
MVHVRIRLPCTPEEPESLREAFLSYATPEDGVGHISIHPGDGGDLTVGFFVTAATLPEAETVAYTVALKALSGEPALRQAYVTSYSAALVPALFDRMLHEPGDDGRWTE